MQAALPAASQAVASVAEHQTVTSNEVTGPFSGFWDTVDALELDDEDWPEAQQTYGARAAYSPFASRCAELSVGCEEGLGAVGSTHADSKSQMLSENTVRVQPSSPVLQQQQHTVSIVWFVDVDYVHGVQICVVQCLNYPECYLTTCRVYSVIEKIINCN